jgi:hypothetical protein
LALSNTHSLYGSPSKASWMHSAAPGMSARVMGVVATGIMLKKRGDGGAEREHALGECDVGYLSQAQEEGTALGIDTAFYAFKVRRYLNQYCSVR